MPAKRKTTTNSPMKAKKAKKNKEEQEQKEIVAEANNQKEQEHKEEKATTEEQQKEPKKKTKSRTPTVSPLAMLDLPLDQVDAFLKRKLILNTALTYEVKVPKELKTLFKKINSHESKVEGEELEILDQAYLEAKNVSGVHYMAQCLQYYSEHHNIPIKKKDQVIIERALTKPTKVTINTMQEIFDHYLCGMEQRHKYFELYSRSGKKVAGVPVKVSNKQATKTKKKIQPYNLFVRDQWEKRREEFMHLAATQKSGAATIMQKLSNEWKANANLKSEYQEKAKLANEKQQQKEKEEIVETVETVEETAM